jgi:hypothetical protein
MIIYIANAAATEKIPLNAAALHRNPIKIFNSVCPDIMFAKSLTDKLITLAT